MTREGKVDRRAACLAQQDGRLGLSPVIREFQLSPPQNTTLVVMSENSFSKRKNTKLKTRKFPSVVVWVR